MKNKVIFIGMVLFMMSFSQIADAQRGYGRYGRGAGWRTADTTFANCRIPDLTEKQYSEIHHLRTDHLRDMTDFRNELREKDARLRTLSASDKADMKEVNRLIEDIGDLKTKIRKAGFRHRQAVRSLLTKDQKVYFDTQGRRGYLGQGYRRGHHGRGNGNYGRGRGYQYGGRNTRGHCWYNW